MYKLYSVPSYKLTDKALKKPKKYNLEELERELELDNDYYFRIHKETQYTLFVDIDGIEESFEEFIDDYMKFMNEHYGLSIDQQDVMYTENKGKKGSYHVSIPKYNASTEKLKEIHDMYKKTIKGNKRVIDTGIYSEHWFRYPNQSKERDVTKRHDIVRGDIRDFIQEYIKEGSEDINEKVYKSAKKEKPIKKEIKKEEEEECPPQKEIPKEEIYRLLEEIDYSQFTEREDWLNFGTILKNLNMTINDFCKYSKKMVRQNHDPCTCMNVYASLRRKIENPIYKLEKLVKENKIISKQNARDCLTIKEISEYFYEKTYPNRESLERDVTEKCKDTIYLYKSGSKIMISIKINYNYENKTKIHHISDFGEFKKNYSYCVMKFKRGGETYVTTNLVKEILINEGLTYDGLYIRPYHPFEEIKEVKGYFNVFSPMIAQKKEDYNMDLIKKILNHIYVVWADRDEMIYRYILSYFHQIIKTPWMSTKVCLVISGEMGVGKSIILEKMLQYIFGSHCGHQTQGLKSITSRFQGWIENKLLIVCEEPTQMNDMNFSEYTETLKNFITAQTMEIEKKGVEKYEIQAYHNLVITCNHLKGIHVPNEKDRRFFIIQCNEEYRNNREYFDGLYKELDNKENMNVLFSYLYDYTETVPLHPIPITKIKREVIEDNMSVYEKFLFHPMCRCDAITETMNKDELYDIFLQWYDGNKMNVNFRPNKIAFYMSMRQYGESKQKMLKGERYYMYKFNEETQKKIRELDRL